MLGFGKKSHTKKGSEVKGWHRLQVDPSSYFSLLGPFPFFFLNPLQGQISVMDTYTTVFWFYG